MSNFTKLSSWACSVACGVCLVLAVLATPRTALADPPGGGEQFVICQLNCSPPNCGGDFCLCTSGVLTCQDDRASRTDCDCLL